MPSKTVINFLDACSKFFKAFFNSIVAIASSFSVDCLLIRHHAFIKNLCSHCNGVYFVHGFIERYVIKEND